MGSKYYCFTIFIFPSSGEWTNGRNILGLITFAIVLGVSLAKLGDKGKPLLDFFTSLSDAMMTITSWVIRSVADNK